MQNNPTFQPVFITVADMLQVIYSAFLTVLAFLAATGFWALSRAEAFFSAAEEQSLRYLPFTKMFLSLWRELRGPDFS